MWGRQGGSTAGGWADRPRTSPRPSSASRPAPGGSVGCQAWPAGASGTQHDKMARISSDVAHSVLGENGPSQPAESPGAAGAACPPAGCGTPRLKPRRRQAEFCWPDFKREMRRGSCGAACPTFSVLSASWVRRSSHSLCSQSGGSTDGSVWKFPYVASTWAGAAMKSGDTSHCCALRRG